MVQSFVTGPAGGTRKPVVVEIADEKVVAGRLSNRVPAGSSRYHWSRGLCLVQLVVTSSLADGAGIGGRGRDPSSTRTFVID